MRPAAAHAGSGARGLLPTGAGKLAWGPAMPDLDRARCATLQRQGHEQLIA